MKKILKPNIIIIGSSRSGKTTLANKISKKYKYNIISIDSIVSGFQKGMPQLNISHDDRSGESANKVTPFIIEYIKSLTSYVQRIKNINYVIEGCYISLDAIKEFINDEFIVIVLTQGLLSSKDFYDEMKEHDNSWDWTYNLSDKELHDYSNNLVENNKYIIDYCKSNNIKYLDISIDRNKKLKNEIKIKEKIVNIDK